MRSVVLVAVIVHLSAAISHSLGFASPALSVLWLPGPLVMAIMLARGGWTPFAAMLGIGTWSILYGHDLTLATGYMASSVVAPCLSAFIMQAWSGWKPTASNLVVTIRMLFTIALVFAPLAGLADALGQGNLPGGQYDLFQSWLGYTLIQAMNGLVLVRAFMALMPDVPGVVCPMVDGRRSLMTIRPAELLAHTIVAFVGVASWVLTATGYDSPSRLGLSAVFIVPVVTALLLERQAASRVLILTVSMVIGLRVAAAPIDSDPGFVLSLSQMVVLLMLCGITLHLLNATTAERSEQRLRLERMAFTNDISGLPNGHALVREIEARLQANPPQRFRLAELVIPDLSNAPVLNGFANAAAIERRVGELMKDRFGHAKLIAHTGTGRFVMLLPFGIDDSSLRDTIAPGLADSGLGLGPDAHRLRCSMGVVDGGIPFNGEIAGVAELLVAASIARKEAWTRPDRFCSMGAADLKMQHHRAHLRDVSITRRAVDAGRLKLLGQPILPAHGKPERLHYEVLARLIDEDGQEIAPSVFLPALASEQMLEEFDRLVIESTLRTLSSNSALRLATGLCAINITGPTLAHAQFPSFLAEQIARYAIDATTLSLEVTESDSIVNLEGARRNVAQLNQIGIAIAVDDFGTGFATFDYLRKFTPQWLKIDGSFVREFDDTPLSREIIVSIVRVAHAIGARTVAEYVENMDIAQRMTELGVDYLQGWAMSRPIPIDSLVQFDPTILKQRNALDRTASETELQV